MPAARSAWSARALSATLSNRTSSPVKNFTKFRDGQVVARFEPRVKPDAREVTEAVEAELKK
jgi:glutathione peroxidase-family protein